MHSQVCGTVKERTMMRKSEYGRDWRGARSKAGCVLLSLLLCIGCITGCARMDRAIVLELQEEGVESTVIQEEAIRTDEKLTQDEEKQPDKEAVSLLYVHVCGAVISPGVVEVQAGSRVEAALLAAGGFREDAARDYVNLAAKVEDGQQLYFPTEEEAEKLPKVSGDSDIGSTSGQITRVNINTAGVEALCTLPGIGDSRARDIIAYREQYGPFKTIEDIMRVSGIKQNAYEKIEDRITVD